MQRNLIRLAALAFITFFIMLVCIADRGEGDQWWAFIGSIPYGDKFGHLGLTSTLALLCNLAIPPRPGTRLTRIFTLVTLVLLVVLSLEELSQAFIPARTCDFFDWLADLAGLSLGQFTASILRRRFLSWRRA
ncbi:MAG: VanZ family protein [Verrucomicrobiota bacterium]